VSVNFSTGDQDVFTASTDMRNYVWSLSEVLDSSSSRYQSKVNWYYTYTNGERVAGPMTLFLGDLFFSTFKPDPTSGDNLCASGQSSVWGMQYLKPQDPANLKAGGLARLPLKPIPIVASDYTQSLTQANSPVIGEHAAIFGIGVTQVPTCANETQSADDFIGGGAMHTTATSVTPGQFQLVFHTGSAQGANTGGRANVQTINLPSPYANPRIDSWAAIIE